MIKIPLRMIKINQPEEIRTFDLKISAVRKCMAMQLGRYFGKERCYLFPYVE